jgi:hypothetical protein
MDTIIIIAVIYFIFYLIFGGSSSNENKKCEQGDHDWEIVKTFIVSNGKRHVHVRCRRCGETDVFEEYY